MKFSPRIEETITFKYLNSRGSTMFLPFSLKNPNRVMIPAFRATMKIRDRELDRPGDGAE